MAVNVFVIEPMRNCVEGVTGEVRLDVALTISPRECHLAVLHHGQSCARYLPVGHRIDRELIELWSEGRNGFAARDRLGRHRKEPSTGVT